MQWNEVEGAIRDITKDIREQCIIKNIAIKEDIFSILENRCTVIYYPLEDKKNRGFHIKRIVKDKLEDFVYINTAKPIAEQIFVAAHELGHIWEAAKKVWEILGYEGVPTEKEEEDITNRFAAELLMPTEAFRAVFLAHMKELGVERGKVQLEVLIRLMVLQMGDFMVPYEAVRKRLVETKLMKQEAAERLLSMEEEVLKIVMVFTKDKNTYLGNGTGVKTISGLRTLIEYAENQENVEDFLIKKIKKDFDLADMPMAEEEMTIHIGDVGDE